MIGPIRKAAVLGSGIMGSGIAAHLANAGIDCLLLDLVPGELTPEEASKGLTLAHPAVRNRRALAALGQLKRTKPAPLYDEAFASRITAGNMEDDWAKLSEADWIIEVIVEELQAKRELLARVEEVRSPTSVVSTNTSGISVNAMTEGRGEAFRTHFLGTHFFNPPRYMQLVEVIPGESTDPEIVQGMKRFLETRLGKSVVLAKDTPNFIANRIGTYGLLVTLEQMVVGGFTVEEVDAVTGPALGRPKSATFRTLDLVGLDTFVHVAGNVRDHVTDAAERETFCVPELLQRMVKEGKLGEKAGRGFYQKQKTAAGSEILAFRPETGTYEPQRKVSGASVEAAKQAKGTAAKIKALLSTGDRLSVLGWNLVKKLLLYSADKVGEIADTVQEIDDAMRWGFGWELGPFETWDAIGLAQSVKRMEAEGEAVPVWVKAWLAAGHSSFYVKRENGIQYAHGGGLRKVERAPEAISLSALKERGRTVRSNSGASLIDLGDGVACLEFHSPHNAIGADILQMINQSVDEVRANYDGLVIANQAKNFCVGANLMLLLMEAQDEEWDEIDGIIKLFQDTMYGLKRFEKPVVAAPHRMTLGGGVEVCLPADQIVASAETYFGLVEFGVGLIPAGGGCKEMALRAAQGRTEKDDDLQPAVNRVFETIGMAKVSTSGHDAKRLGLMRPGDRIVLNPDHLIHEAKQAVLRMVEAGYEPIREEPVRVVGRDGKAVMQLGAYMLRQGGYISDHDWLIAKKLAHVLAGGDVPAGTLVSERHLLELEREVFLSLCGEPKTQQRMQHMLATGKPLRN